MLAVVAAALLYQRPDPKVAFNPPNAPAYAPQGGIKSDDFKVEHRDANGNVEGTEFVHLEYTVSTRIVELPNPSMATWDTCSNDCQGGKHADHAQCDLSCDKPCTRNHILDLTGYAEELRDNMKKMTADSAALNKRGSAGASSGAPDWSSAVSKSLREAEAAAKSDVAHYAPAHIKTPCAWEGWIYGFTVSQFQVHGEMHKVGFYMTQGKKTPIDESIGTQDGVVALLYHPAKGPIETAKGVVCKCKNNVDVPPGGPKEIGHWPTTHGMTYEKGDKVPVIPGDDQIKIDVTGIDMNEVQIEIDNLTNEDLRIILEAGAMLIADLQEIQDMIILEGFNEVVPAASHTRWVLSTRPEISSGHLSAKPRIACTEIAKHEPNSKVKFRIETPTDSRLARLCDMYKLDSIHFGGLDQTRVWLATSHSTLDEINQRMFPRVLPGTYVNALSDCATVGYDMAGKDFAKCHSIAYLEGSTARTKAVAWYIGYWESHDLKALIAYGPKLVQHETSALAANQSIEQRHAADLAAALIGSNDGQVRAIGLQILAESVPEASRATVIERGGLGSLWKSMASGDEAEILKALSTIDAYGDKSFAAQVAGLAFYSPNANVKAAAAALKSRIGG